VPEPGGPVEPPAETSPARPGTSPSLTGGDVDADWSRADAGGDEAVGGTVATPDQDVVDEIGRALGVEQASDAPVVTSDEILRQRDRFRWHLDRDAEERAREEERREEERREEEEGQ
jgi:hypothetical protein